MHLSYVAGPSAAHTSPEEGKSEKTKTQRTRKLDGGEKKSITR